MNIISYNIRGLGRGIKWAAIRRMVHTEQIDLHCIQKTKRESIHRSACQALWGDREIGWESQPVNNTAGGKFGVEGVCSGSTALVRHQ